MHIDITIEGVTPLLMNRFTDEAAGAATSGTRSTFKGDKGTPREQAEERLYLDNDDTICIPQPNILRCIIDGGIYFRNGQSKITTMKSSLIPGVVMIHGIMLPLLHEGQWEVDTRPIRIPATGGRILRHRPMFEKWAVEIPLELDETELPEKLFRQVVDASGKKVGLGDYRPNCKGPFGRFVVVKWERI